MRKAQDHEKLNHVVFTESQADLIESERPVGGIPIPTSSGYELAAYLMPNGSRFVTLMDKSEETWEDYCKELASKSIVAEGSEAHKRSNQ